MKIRIPWLVTALVILASAVLSIGLVRFFGTGEESGEIVRSDLAGMHDALLAGAARASLESVGAVPQNADVEKEPHAQSSGSDASGSDAIAVSDSASAAQDVREERPVSSGPRIEPGTPVEFTSIYYLSGHVPVEIRADGTQVYADIPMRVRMPDGTFEERRTTMSIKPQPSLPMAGGSGASDTDGMPSSE